MEPKGASDAASCKYEGLYGAIRAASATLGRSTQAANAAPYRCDSMALVISS
jgi:hypothetical protein